MEQETKQDTKQDVKKITNQMAFVGILGNIFLAVFKLIAGIVGHSTAMLSDSIHTLSDVIATFIAYLGVVLSRKKLMTSTHTDMRDWSALHHSYCLLYCLQQV